jgi:hypothetical protein
MINDNTEVDNSPLLANEFFKDLKTKLKKIDISQIEDELRMIFDLIEDAKEVGQEKLAENYQALAITYAKERLMFKEGYTQFVKKNDIEKYIENVKDQVVKICELKNFPRTLPNNVKDVIKKAKVSKLYDDMWVVFIDYEEKDNLSKEEKSERQKNRDPILFATIKESMDRFYFLVDWNDDICTLRFEDMVKGLKKLDKTYKVASIVKDPKEYLDMLIADSTQESYQPTEKTRSVWSKIQNLWK